jgi:hypothetical protein
MPARGGWLPSGIDRHVFLRPIVRRERHYRQLEVQAKLRHSWAGDALRSSGHTF